MSFRVTSDLAGYLGDKSTGRALPGGAILMSAIKVDVTDGEEGVQYDLQLEIDVVHGHPVCTVCTIQQRDGGPPVMRSGLAALPLDRLIRRAVKEAAIDPEAESLLAGLPVDRTAALEKGLVPRRGRRGNPDAQRQLIETVAAMYRDLTGRGVKKPKPQIARALGYSPSYIGALVGEARKTNPPLLGPAHNDGRAGEAAVQRRSTAKKGKR